MGENSNCTLQKVNIPHGLGNNRCDSFPDEGGGFVYILENTWQALLPFCQEKSPSSIISTWAFIIPNQKAKNIKESWEGGVGKGANMCLAVYATLSLTTLSCSIQNWLKAFHQTSLAQLWYPSSLTDSPLNFLLFCLLKVLY